MKRACLSPKRVTLFSALLVSFLATGCTSNDSTSAEAIPSYCPSAAAVSLAAGEGPNAYYQVLATDSSTSIDIILYACDPANPDSSGLSWAIADEPQGNLSGWTGTYPDGVIKYTPLLGYAGTDSFTYYVTNGSSVSNTAEIQIVVSDPAASPGVWYVDISATARTEDGLAWSTAFRHPQTAVNAAAAGDRILVAAGTYSSLDTNDLTVPVLTLKDDILLYGGYAGAVVNTGEDPQRFPEANRTYLDGNSWTTHHVVIGASNVLIDGFTIRDGYATGQAPSGIVGGAMVNDGVSNLQLVNCEIEDSGALGDGGGFWNRGSELFLTQCLLSGNWNENAANGGGMYNENSSVYMENSIIKDNYADGSGGGLYNASGSTGTIVYSTVSGSLFGNQAATGAGGGAFSDGTSSLTVVNSVFYGNIDATGGSTSEIIGPAVISYSDIAMTAATPWPGDGNINLNPGFVNNFLHFDNCSPLIDVALDIGILVDHGGGSRPDDLGFDMGAWEGYVLINPFPCPVLIP